ncbi:MAG: carbamoyl phosphate synthase large subunit, partial [Chlamydiota bacterium]
MDAAMTKSVLLLGSGGLKIGQAGEFDYSGTQAIKALKEEGLRILLVNPNIATVQTDSRMADEVYLQPLNVQTVEKIIVKERPQFILLQFGGQTALNLGLELETRGILKKYKVKVLGTSLEGIRQTEDRELFKQNLNRIGIPTPFSHVATNVEEAVVAGRLIGFPLMLRSGFSLGGLGSGKI